MVDEVDGWLGWVGGLVLLAKKPPLILCSLRALTDGASSSRLGSVLQQTHKAGQWELESPTSTSFQRIAFPQRFLVSFFPHVMTIFVGFNNLH